MAYGSQGVYLGLLGQPTDIVSLKAGQKFKVPPGQWMLQAGLYSTIQERSPVTGQFQPYGPNPGPGGLLLVNSDGSNWLVTNPTGCAVGAIITTAGSGMLATAPPTVTPSAGSSVWTPIIGGAISTTITIQTGGSNYTYPPLVQIAAPSTGPNPAPSGPGFGAAATCALTTGAVSSVTVTQQGAGYQVAPVVTFINDPRDTTGGGATATTALTGAGTLTGLVVTDFGTPLTAVPTLTFSAGGSAATVIMDWTLTAATLTNAGSGYTASSVVRITSGGGIVAGTATLTNPAYDKRMFPIRQADVSITTDASGILQVGQIIVDGGRFQAAPTLLIIDGMKAGGPATTAAILAPVMGGVTDTLRLYAAPK